MLVTTVTNFADSSSGLSSLGIDGKAFLIQLVTFLLAFWVLKRYAFEPIVKLMEQRRKTIEEGVSLGEQMKKDKAALEAKVSEELAKARTEADGIIAEANDAARQAVREAEEKATAKAAVIVKEGQDRAAAEMTRARKKLEGQIVGWVSDATEAIIGEKVDAKKDADIIDRALKEQQNA
ncbi:MAG TPA: F0F1 ATP synthase subunit B [Ktedonobacteraceae bacterium]|jgi:F-type H+-transporting ATPase subunit b|nr:F0F1 ATP synthase subunit B [Ktedonobacteraceae bacterium]